MENIRLQEINRILLREAQAKEITVDEVIVKLIGIGFCQPKFYKASVWSKVKKVMLFLADMKVGIIHKPYRGAGHFWTDDMKNDIREMSYTEQINFFKDKLKDKLVA